MTKYTIETFQDMIESYVNGNRSIFSKQLQRMNSKNILHLAAVWEAQGRKVGDLISIRGY